MSDVTIKARKNGPYEIRGPVTLIDFEENPIPVAEDEKVFLCRCGQSANKPFCDSTHKVNGWCDTAADQE